MKLEAYETEARLEETHWWFVVRRKLFSALIAKLKLDKKDMVLDVGTSTGTNLRMLQSLKFEAIRGLDYSEHAISFCRSKGLPEVEQGDICAMPFSDNSFELILATDIIEHVDDDKLALTEIVRVLKPGGYALVTVPMFMSLWGPQDDVSLHKRRYRRREIQSLIKNFDIKVVDAFYFNSLLFIPIWFTRLLLKKNKPDLKSENDVNSPFINKTLTKVFELDTVLARFHLFPFGVSYLMLLQKAEDK